MWQKEIEEILARANLEPEINWEEFFKAIMPMVLLVMLFSAGARTIHSPEMRQKLRRALAEMGLPKRKIEEAIDWLIKSGTMPIKQERNDGWTDDGSYSG